MSPHPRDTARATLGKLGETVAAEELRRLGYVILSRNYRCTGGEADLVAEDGDTLVFVEVKTRSQFRHGLPRDAVGWTKQQRLARAAEDYCARHQVEDRPLRFDVVEIVILRGEIAAVELIRDAFVPE